MRRTTWISPASLVTLAFLAGACSGTDVRQISADPLPKVAVADRVADVLVRGSIEQVSMTGADPGDPILLMNGQERLVARATADDQGSVLFRGVAPGAGYRVQVNGSTPAVSKRVEVMTLQDSRPAQPFYADQQINTDYGYITTRDGTTLSTAVYLPGPPEDGPYPTVVEYSGYSPSNPTKSIAADLAKTLGVEPESLCGVISVACNSPDQPGSTLAAAMGYAVVAVNMRGTGCSGGAYDFFEPLQLTDGYDVIETVAAQPWVLNNRVGMVGLSYPGIAQLFVASTQPPSLAAITPLSVYDDTARGTLAPGGIFNEGFALTWAQEVLENAEPYGQGWEQQVVDGGDTTCADNQLLRDQNVDAVAKAKSNPFYTDEVAAQLDLTKLVGNIDVPVFLTGAWQDEQTGGRFARLFDRFTNAPVTRFTAFNGAHGDGFAPQVLSEWKAFLDIYVAGKVTGVPDSVRSFGPVLFQDVFKATVDFPPDRWVSDRSFAETKAAYEAEDPIRIIFDNGAGNSQPGAPVGRWEQRFTTWPFDGTQPERWYLGDEGQLSDAAPTDTTGGSRFEFDPALAEKTTLKGKVGEAFHAQPAYRWEQDTDTGSAVFETPAIQEPMVYGGTGSVDLFVRSSADDADLGVTLSEVDRSGKETYISAGWLRASGRALDPEATELDPNISGRESQVKPLVPGEWTPVRIEIFPFAHVIRPGSKLRISVHSPGGDRPRWSWIVKNYPAGTTFDVAHDATRPSSVLLPALPGLRGFPAEAAPCKSLRGQPCRDAVAQPNTPAPT